MTSPSPPRPVPNGRGRLLAWPVVVLFALAVLLSAGNYLWTSYLVHKSQHAWCTIISLSLAPKPPPHPSREQEVARLAIEALGRTYGCPLN